MKPWQPQLSAQLDDLTDVTLQTETSYENIRLQNPDFSDVVALNISFDECELLRPLFSGAKLQKLQLRDVRLQGGDATALNASDGGALRVIFSDLRMTGFDVSQSIYKNVLFKNCKLNMANFRFAAFTHVRFEECDLTDADFQNATLNAVTFQNCVLHKAQFSNVQCKNVDMRTSDLHNLGGWQSLAGVTIDSVQLMHIAGELAHELNITVADD